LQEFRSCRMRAAFRAWVPDPRTPATPELLQLLTPDFVFLPPEWNRRDKGERLHGPAQSFWTCSV